MNTPINIFLSYSTRDNHLREELQSHLASLERRGRVRTQDHRDIGAGEDWRKGVHERLRSARIILLLVSSDFLASDYCYEVELSYAIQRHDAGEANVIPIIIRDCVWSEAPFATLRVLPTGGQPVTSYAIRDEIWKIL